MINILRLGAVVLGISCVTGARGQVRCTLILSGRVEDERLEGLPQATITLTPGDHHAVCDAQGRFRMEGLCPGEYRVEARFLGYKTLDQPLTLRRSTTRTFSMEMGQTLLDPLEVDADQTAAEAGPHSYSAVSRAQLERAQGESLGELLAHGVAGVATIQTGPAIFKPVIHGVHSQRVLILDNGLRFEGQQWGADHAPPIDPLSAGSIVIIKDAGAVKYGADAIGGVVLITPPPLPDSAGIGGRFGLQGASNGWGGSAAGMVEGGIKGVKGLGWRAQGKWARSGDFNAPGYTLSNTGLEEYTYKAAAGFHRGRFGADVSFSGFHSRIGILRGAVVGNLHDLATALRRAPPAFTREFGYEIANPRQAVSHHTGQVHLHYERGPASYRLDYGVQANERREYDVRRGGLNNAPALHLRLVSHTLELEAERNKGEKFSQCIGFSGLAQTNANVAGTYRIPFIPNYQGYGAGFYGVARLRLGKALLEAGARYDYKGYDVAGLDLNNKAFHSRFGLHSASGTLGASYKASSRITITSNVGTAWRPLSMAELYSAGLHQGVASIEYGLLLSETDASVRDISQTQVKNEQAVKWVSTLEFAGPKLLLQASAYINYIFNYTYLRPRGVTQDLRGIYPYFRYTQTDASFVGVDLTASYAILPTLNANLKASWLHASDARNHDYLIWTPANRAELGAQYNRAFARGKYRFSAAVRGIYTLRQYRAPATLSIDAILGEAAQGGNAVATLGRNFDFVDAPHGYFLLEAETGLRIVLGKGALDVRLSLRNAANTAYREYTNRMRYYAGEVGRNARLEVYYTF